MGAAPTLARLLRASGAVQARLAERIVADGVPWSEWARRFNETYARQPERGERAARALERAALARRDAHAAARLRAMRGGALQRSGSPAEASRLLLDAEPGLSAAGDHERASQALVLAVDALGHAGETEEALRCAKRAAARIRGPRARLWRAFLRANRANVLRLAGRLDEAARESDAAARALAALGEAPSAAAARLNAGVALMYAGRLRPARRRFEDALACFEEAGHADRAQEARYNLACLDVRAGALGGAISVLERLAHEHAERGLRRREALCRMDLADALRRAGDTASSTREAKRAAALFDREDAPAESVEALWLASASLAASDPDEALALADGARQRALASGRPEIALRCDLLRADLLLRRDGRTDASALRRLERAAQRLGQDEILAEARLMRAASALARGAVARARAALDRLPRSAREHPWLSVAAATAEARVLRAEGDLGGAIRRLRALVRKLEVIRSALRGAWLRSLFLFERLDPYTTLVGALLDRGRAPDRREAEEVLDALALERFLEARPPKAVSARVARLRKRLERLYDRLADGAGPTRGLNPAQRVALLDAVRRLEREAAEAWRRAERRAATRRPDAVVSIAAPRGDAAFVHVWLQDDVLHALVRRSGVVHDTGPVAPVSELAKAARELSFHAMRVRLADTAHARRACESTLGRLSDLLVPRLDLGRFGDRVRLVLDPRLPDLPWELLLTDDGQPLAAAYQVARVPAVRLPRRRLLPGRGMAVVAAGESDLAGVSREALDVGRGARLLRGPAARRDRVTEALRTRRVVHLAMHGAAAPDAPALGGVRLADGWFTAADVPGRVAAEVVSLAACQTGAPPGAPGRAWGAIPDALLRSGVRWVVWTSADVDDETTADLMSAFHRVRPMQGVPEAFGRALVEAWECRGTPAGLLPFRLSGGRS